MVTVIVVVPAVTAVTNPVELTVAIAVLLDDQVTFLFVAVVGATVAVSCVVAPVVMLAVGGVTLTPVTRIEALLVVITNVAVSAPAELAAIIPTLYVPLTVDAPDIKPVVVSIDNPAGKLVA